MENINKITPKTKEELRDIIERELATQGMDADLNFIDTSQITDMSCLFAKLNVGNIKIDKWDVSNVTNMCMMFIYCKSFNSDLSNWNVSNVADTTLMFYRAESFISNLSKWKISDGNNLKEMFEGTPMEHETELYPKFK